MVGISEKSRVPVAKAARGEETVTLRGTSRGFELIIADGVDADAIIGSAYAQLAKSPGFFAGSDVIIQFAGHPVPGTLGPLEEIASEFELTIVAIRSGLESRKETTKAALAVVSDLLDPEATDSIEVDLSDAETAEDALEAPVIAMTPEPAAAIESAPVEALEAVTDTETAADTDALADTGTDTDVLADTDAGTDTGETTDASTDVSTDADELDAACAPELEITDSPSSSVSAEAFDAVRALALQAPDAAKIIIGPVRSGCILEATEHLVIVGDVNPGAEVTSIGAIVVLGRMRGIAHAGAGGNPSFIFALQLEPQQLRLGTKVARASDGDNRGTRPEIARIENEQIIVEPYAGRLPFSLANVLS